MIKVSVMYANSPGARFDHDYYRDTHIPLCQQTWSPLNTEIDRGLNGPFVAAVHFTFASREAMDEALKDEGTGAIMADVKNYTSITPQMQISEVVS